MIKIGTIGSGRYFLMNVLLGVTWAILSGLFCRSSLLDKVHSPQELQTWLSMFALLFVIPLQWMTYARMADAELPYWMRVMLSLPVVNLVAVPYLCVLPGEKDRWHSDGFSLWGLYKMLLLGLVLSFLGLFSFLYATTSYRLALDTLMHR